jgi:DmsE family decaheme c-type cytochrome
VDTRSLCAKCHADKTGPFVYRHADLLDDCGRCHTPHGSSFGSMLRYQEPFLCLQCHAGHTEKDFPDNPYPGFKRGMLTKCTNCHSQVHGSDTPGSLPKSGFIY